MCPAARDVFLLRYTKNIANKINLLIILLLFYYSLFIIRYSLQFHAGIAQLVEHNLAKVGVASSNLVSRSKTTMNNEQ